MPRGLHVAPRGAYTLHHGLEGVVLGQELRHLLACMVNASESATLAEAATWAKVAGCYCSRVRSAAHRANGARFRKQGGELWRSRDGALTMLPCRSPSSRACMVNGGGIGGFGGG